MEVCRVSKQNCCRNQYINPAVTQYHLSSLSTTDCTLQWQYLYYWVRLFLLRNFISYYNSSTKVKAVFKLYVSTVIFKPIFTTVKQCKFKGKFWRCKVNWQTLSPNLQFSINVMLLSQCYNKYQNYIITVYTVIILFIPLRLQITIRSQ